MNLQQSVAYDELVKARNDIQQAHFRDAVAASIPAMFRRSMSNADAAGITEEQVSRIFWPKELSPASIAANAASRHHRSLGDFDAGTSGTNARSTFIPQIRDRLPGDRKRIQWR